MTPPATASPKDSPKEPAAEFTPAASLTRSSLMGARVKLLSCETSMPSPEPAITKGMTKYHPESTLGTKEMIAAMPTALRAKPVRTIWAGRLLPALRPASMAMPNMDSEKGRERQPGLHGVVFEGHL